MLIFVAPAETPGQGILGPDLVQRLHGGPSRYFNYEPLWAALEELEVPLPALGLI